MKLELEVYGNFVLFEHYYEKTVSPMVSTSNGPCLIQAIFFHTSELMNCYFCDSRSCMTQ